MWRPILGRAPAPQLPHPRRVAEDPAPEPISLSKLLWFVGATAGGWLGWWLGSLAGTFAAYLLSVVGTALGVYWARRYTEDHF